MKKITTKKLSERLMQYGALSAAALGVVDANGQVVYTDINPDQVLNVGDDFAVDLTGGGTNLFTVNNPSGLSGGNAAIVFPSSGGAFVGITAGNFNYPSLLVSGDAIDAAATFTAVGARGDLNYYGCAYSNSQWCGAVVDGYLGIKFTLSGNTHYGWIRLDTDVNGSNVITIKDFAYDATPDTAINAGDQGTSGVEDQVLAGFNYFVNANHQLNISARTEMKSIQLFDLLGQQVLSQDLNGAEAMIDLNSLETGIYLAKVNVSGKIATFKIVKR